MSYILDALAKSEKERQRGAAPTLNTQHASAAPEHKSHSRWPYVLAGALPVAVLSAAWLLAGKREAERVHEQPAQAVARAEIAPAEERPKAPAVAPPELQPKSPASAAAAATPAQDKSSATIDQADDARKKPQLAEAKASPSSVERVRPGPAQVRAEPTQRAAPAPEPRAGILALAELPLPVRQEIPEIVVSGYSHSADRSQRMAVVNQRLVQEGDELAAGLKVEAIAADGIVFSYKNYRFRKVF